MTEGEGTASKAAHFCDAFVFTQFTTQNCCKSVHAFVHASSGMLLAVKIDVYCALMCTRLLLRRLPCVAGLKSYNG